jgi:hypothetical protein
MGSEIELLSPELHPAQGAAGSRLKLNYKAAFEPD